MDTKQEGIWLLDLSSLMLTWAGEPPIPGPSLRERIGFVALYIKSRGLGPTIMDCMKRLAKSLAFILKSSQVSWSGNPNVTTGRSIEEEWTSFKTILWDSPQQGQAKVDILAAKSSN